MPALKLTAFQPFEHRLLSDAERGRGTLDRVAAIRPTGRIMLDAVDLYGGDISALAQQVHRVVVEQPVQAVPQTLYVERGSDFGVHHASGVELSDPRF